LNVWVSGLCYACIAPFPAGRGALLFAFRTSGRPRHLPPIEVEPRPSCSGRKCCVADMAPHQRRQPAHVGLGHACVRGRPHPTARPQWHGDLTRPGEAARQAVQPAAEGTARDARHWRAPHQRFGRAVHGVLLNDLPDPGIEGPPHCASKTPPPTAEGHSQPAWRTHKKTARYSCGPW